MNYCQSYHSWLTMTGLFYGLSVLDLWSALTNGQKKKKNCWQNNLLQIDTYIWIHIFLELDFSVHSFHKTDDINWYAGHSNRERTCDLSSSSSLIYRHSQWWFRHRNVSFFHPTPSTPTYFKRRLREYKFNLFAPFDELKLTIDSIIENYA